MSNFEREISNDEFLADIADADERERFRREFCILDSDEGDRFGFGDRQGGGPNALLNAAITGADLRTSLLGTLQDEALVDEMLQEQQAAATAKARASAYLTRADVQELYDAVSFLTQEYGIFMNGFITVAYTPLGINDGRQMTRLLTDFLDEAGHQMDRWGHRWHAVYVHECSAERGLHTHLLVHIPTGLRKAFVKWAKDDQRSFFKRHCPKMTAAGVDLQLKEPTTVASKASWQWDRVQYMTKGLDPDVMARDLETGALTPLFDLIGQRPNYRRAAGVIPFRQRVGVSKSIRSKSRSNDFPEGLPSLSAFEDRAWPYLRLDSPNLGWEMHEFIVRKGMQNWIEEQRIVRRGDPDLDSYLAMLKLTWEDLPLLSNKDSKQVLDWIWEARVHHVWTARPYSWRRIDWRGWWETLPGLARWGGPGVRKEVANRSAAAHP